MSELTIDIDELGAAIARSMATNVKDHERLWNSSQCAEYLGLRLAESFMQNVAPLPSFPSPVQLPSTRSKKRCGAHRWVASEVIQWALSHKRKDRK